MRHASGFNLFKRPFCKKEQLERKNCAEFGPINLDYKQTGNSRCFYFFRRNNVFYSFLIILNFPSVTKAQFMEQLIFCRNQLFQRVICVLFMASGLKGFRLNFYLCRYDERSSNYQSYCCCCRRVCCDIFLASSFLEHFKIKLYTSIK